MIETLEQMSHSVRWEVNPVEILGIFPLYLALLLPEKGAGWLFGANK